MIRILIVDDSPSMALLLQALIQQQPDLQVAGLARDGLEAVRLAEQLRPDVITMDVRMPGLDGIEATRQIMERTPTPIVVISAAVGDPELQVSFRALAYGAVAVLEKPPAPSHPGFELAARDLVDTLRSMAGVRVLRRRAGLTEDALRSAAAAAPLAPQAPGARRSTARLLAIAASTGGPQALMQLLSGLPADYRLPIVVVQHISPGFIGGMCEWLNGGCSLRCSVATEGQLLRPGQVLFAPDACHLSVVDVAGRLSVRLIHAPPVARHLPSAVPMFDSVADCCGSQALGLMLTGMGQDGASGLLRMRQRGALTLAQSPASCIVPNMPQAAIECGAVAEVLDLSDLADRLNELQDIRPVMSGQGG